MKLFPPSCMVMNGAYFYSATHVMLSEFGGKPAFLSSRPGTLTAMLSVKELTALENALGDGWRVVCRPGNKL